MRQIFLSALVFAIWATAGGCRSTDESFTPYLARIYLEESPNLPDSHVTEMILPVSGTRVTVASRPEFVEWDVQQAAYFDTELGRAIMLILTPKAAAELYRTTIDNQGRNFVLTINGLAVGGRYIDGPIADGRLAFFLETDPEEIPEVVKGIQETSNRIQKRMNSEGW